MENILYQNKIHVKLHNLDEINFFIRNSIHINFKLEESITFSTFCL